MSDIEAILREAAEAGASDVHLTVGIPPRMRVNGNLIPMNDLKMQPADTLDILISLMSETQREKYEERGEYDFSLSLPGGGRCRVNAYKQRDGAALAFRLLSSAVSAPEELGIPQSVMELYRCRKGLVIVAGAAGSGKTTTLAALVNKINHNRDVHIITLEKPVEYLHHHSRAVVSQREIGIDSESYASALEAAVREDPDVIVIGELGDAETVSMALDAAEMGYLVLASLHTSGAVRTVRRLIDMFPAHRQQQFRIRLAEELEAVVSQQLIPAETGDRAAAFEVLRGTREMRRVIREDRLEELSGVMREGGKAGMITMDEALAGLYRSGRIDRENAVRFALEPDNMEQRLL